MRPGTVGVIPTDTIYGVVARAADQEAVDRLYQLKKREHKPGTIVAANIEQLVNLGIKRRYLKAVEHLWPGPLSVEIPHTIDYLNQSTGRQAFRLRYRAGARNQGRRLHEQADLQSSLVAGAEKILAGANALKR